MPSGHRATTVDAGRKAGTRIVAEQGACRNAVACQPFAAGVCERGILQ